MTNSGASFIATAVMLLAGGCGGGSANKGQSTGSPGAASAHVSTRSGAVVTAKNRGFSTVTPAGFSYEPSSTQYYATGTAARGLAPAVVVVRQSVREGDLNTLVHKTLRALRKMPKALTVSGLRSLSVDGEPAFAVDYVVKSGKPQHVTLVFVRHGEWIYNLRGFSSPALYTTASTALGEMIRNWHWL
jgi:hypothetical protein